MEVEVDLYFETVHCSSPAWNLTECTFGSSRAMQHLIHYSPR